MKAWLDFLKKQEQKLGSESVQKWLLSLKILNYDACNLYLEAENSFQVAFFEEHLRPILKKEFLNNNFHPVKVHLQLKNSPENQTKKGPFKKSSPLPTSAFNFTSENPSLELTFQSFLPTAQNEMAYKFFLELAGFQSETNTFSSPKVFAPPFNPIFLHGPSGSGKTHLLNALALQLQQAKIAFVYVNAMTFTEHVVEALRFGGIEAFRAQYRHIDALLIDDIQILAKKSATQEEFFHTFNTLHMANKLIVLTSLYPPGQLKEIEERLISRFQWGLPLSLEALDEISLLTFLAQKATELKLQLTNEALTFLIQSFPSTKELQRAIQALALRHENKSQELTANLISELLFDLLAERQKKQLTADLIIEEIAHHFELTKEDLLSKGQMKELSFARQIAIYFLRQRLSLTYQKIGAIFDRDHSTIMTSYKNIEAILNSKIDKNHALIQTLTDTLPH